MANIHLTTVTTTAVSLVKVTSSDLTWYPMFDEPDEMQALFDLAEEAKDGGRTQA